MEEKDTANRIELFFKDKQMNYHRKLNNVWAYNRHFKQEAPTLLLNSHHDTVAPNQGWTLDPFKPFEKDGKIYGLGSNDAGGSLVSLIAVFRYFYHRADLKFNLVIAATAEEENSGVNGIEAIFADLGKVDFAIVGEPTGMQMAIAEKGLVVLDCVARGKSGHAARDNGENAIIKAIQDIQWFHSYRFPKESETLGPIRMTVTMIQAGVQHNIIPDTCQFTVDIRTTDAYSNEEIVEIVKRHVQSEVTPRSTRLQPSKIEKDHPLVQAAQNLGIRLFGSPTTSDQAVIPVPSVKMGPGESERSHTADEFIYKQEIKEGIEKYIEFLEKLNEKL